MKYMPTFAFSKHFVFFRLTSIAISNALESHFVSARGVSLSVILSTSPAFKSSLSDLSKS